MVMVQKLMGIVGRCGYIRGAHALEGRGSCQYTIEVWVIIGSHGYKRGLHGCTVQLLMGATAIPSP